MSGTLRFDGRVAIVTGAGNGLGREYALGFAARGAKVVVNDLGGNIKGEGGASRSADLVVQEIRSKGGEAVANYDSVENGEKVVQTALDNYGKVDIIVNNAGILRDRSFARISDLDWDLIQRVHLRGAFTILRAAWPHMKKQSYGRIINTTSTSGMYGNFGQANYGAAKMGLVGMTNTLAAEGIKYNILVNNIAPTAGSRLTATVMPPELLDLLKPEYVAPVVLYLCHESCEETGSTFECGGGWVAKTEFHRARGAVPRVKGMKMTPEQVRDKWEKICDTTDYTNDKTSPAYETAQSFLEEGPQIKEAPTASHSTAGAFGSGVSTPVRTSRPVANKTSSSGIDPNVAIGQKLPESKFTYSERDAILYALGVGVSTAQTDHLKFLFEMAEDFCVVPSYGAIVGQAANRGSMSRNSGGLKIDPTQGDKHTRHLLLVGESTTNADHLKFLFEMSEEFCVLPSFGVVPAFPALSALASGQSGVNIDPTQILHGEQYLELYKPLPTSGTVTSHGTISDVIDKGRGAVIIADVETFDENGDKLFFNQFVTFVQNAGGFGGKRTSAVQKPTADPPKRAPDASITEKTSIDQAALYRLSGDRNPLHIDPSFAAMGGFPKPILHGLASFGYATRHVLKQYANNDVTKFKAIKVRFSRPVLPGQSIQTDMWKEGNRVFITCKVVETGQICLQGAYVDLHGSAPGGASVEESSSGLPSDQIFDAIKYRVSEDPSLVKKVKAIFSWKITQGGKPATEWTVDLKSGSGSVYQGAPKSGKADCTVTLEDSTFMDLASGKINGQMAFLKGKLKIKGNIMLAQKIGQLFQDQAKL